MKSLEPNPPRILIADDQADVREALRLLLKGEGFRTETVHSPAEVLAAIAQSEFVGDGVAEIREVPVRTLVGIASRARSVQYQQPQPRELGLHQE